MDDDISLNFAQSSNHAAPARRQVVPKGGRWTDRVKARKGIRDAQGRSEATSVPSSAFFAGSSLANAHRPEALAPPVPSRVRKPSGPPERPQPQTTANRAAASAPKRLENISESRPSPVRPRMADLGYQEVAVEAGPSRIPLPSTTSSAHKAAKPSGPGPQVISSLFSYNPTVPAISKPSVSQSNFATAASNAPLGDTSTFAGLGLHELLVRHLKGKMSVDKPTGVQSSSLPYLLSSPLNLDATASGEVDEEDNGEQANGVDFRPHGGRTTPPRDAFIQSQTGSGKTLAYLLPIIQTLLPLSKLSYIDRSIGTLAIILAPTRELAQQISKVLEQILSLSLAQTESAEDQAPMTRWLVSGLLTGGSTKTHEKAKLRKGVPILVATPGRLLDHLQNSTAFRFAKTMFLVLDEADRLMDLGFEETIRGIIKALDGRRRAEMAGEDEADVGMMKWGFWGRGRQSILCSATIDAKVEKLAGVALKDPIVFRAEPELGTSSKADIDGSQKKQDPLVASAIESANAIILPPPADEKFTPPSQLSQRYMVVPTKLRLVALVALLRSLVTKKSGSIEAGNKVIVFMSSTDAVDYHWKLLGGIQMGGPAQPNPDEANGHDEDENESAEEDDSDSDDSHKEKEAAGTGNDGAKPKFKGKVHAEDPITLTSPLFSTTTLNRLHGSLPLRTRLASLAAFAKPSPSPAILICTSVASRGLDLPLVRSVVQFDLPTEGGANEYVHRVGRTARAGKGGEAWAFVGPSEVDWVEWVRGKMGTAEGKAVGLTAVGVEDMLRKGFGGKGFDFERRATEVQGGFERWVLSDDKALIAQNAALARKAFASFVRAYSTHPLEEKRFFHTKSLHLGHLAKAFALRDAPSSMAGLANKPSKQNGAGEKKRKRHHDDEDEDETEREKKGGKESTARNETERRMYEAVRKQGRELKSGGKLGQFGGSAKGGGAGGSEFQVLGTGDLERMLAGKV